MDKVQQSIDFLRKLETDDPYSLGFSGGKDSVVILDLARTCRCPVYGYLCQYDCRSAGNNIFY